MIVAVGTKNPAKIEGIRNLPAIVGLGLGVFLGNFSNPFSLGPIDVIGGTIANVLATTLA